MIIYKNVHKGVTFCTDLYYWAESSHPVHSYKNFGLYLAGKTIGSPDVYTYKVEIPGRDGVLDLTEQLYKSVKYKNRKIQIDLLLIDAEVNWASVYSLVADRIHGKKMYVTFDEDKNWSYYGRVTIDMFKTAQHKGTISLTVDAEPYKIWNLDPFEIITIDGRYATGWKWDPFNFQNGYIQENVWNVGADGGTKTITLYNKLKPVKTQWLATADATVTGASGTYSIPGNAQWVELPFALPTNGIYEFTIQSTGTVRCGYRMGGL